MSDPGGVRGSGPSRSCVLLSPANTKLLPPYLDEMEFRFNYGENAYSFRDTLLVLAHG